MGLKTEGTMLIPEMSHGSTSAKAIDNRKEVREATSEDMCNSYLKDGWGLLMVTPAQYYHEARGVVFGVVYIMSRTVVK